MEDSLLSYFNMRFAEKPQSKKRVYPPGPAITISREVGCNGMTFANLIAKNLNAQYNQGSWSVLSKEIFYASANELDVDYQQISKLFKHSERYTFDEILKSFNNKRYKSERKIINTVIDVVYTFASEGYCIIVGRGGHVIAKDIKNTLHLKLVAPIEYRINSIMKKKNLSEEKAIEFIEQVENERHSFRKAIKDLGKGNDNFDLIINVATFNNNSVLELIDNAANHKQIMADYQKQVHYF